MTLEEWIEAIWQEDENRASRKRQINELREEVKSKIVEIFESGKSGPSGCTCDGCITSFFKNQEDKGKLPTWLVNRLVCVAVEYLLGENFNGAAARYYYDYVKQSKNEN